jgi:hypothetical protein
VQWLARSRLRSIIHLLMRFVRLQRWRELSDAQKGAIEARAKELKDEYESVLHRSHHHASQPASKIDVWKTLPGVSNTGFPVLCHVPPGRSLLSCAHCTSLVRARNEEWDKYEEQERKRAERVCITATVGFRTATSHACVRRARWMRLLLRLHRRRMRRIPSRRQQRRRSWLRSSGSFPSSSPSPPQRPQSNRRQRLPAQLMQNFPTRARCGLLLIVLLQAFID